jgi:uncharacterized membrane protein YqjE
MLIGGFVNPGFNRLALVLMCCVLYALSVLVPWLVVRANRRAEQTSLELSEIRRRY